MAAANKNFFESMKASYTDVPVDESKDSAISTTQFLDASESLASLFDVIGGMAFSPVKNDILGNVKKLRTRQLEAPAESESIQSLVVNEIKAKKHTAAEGLLWLVRGLDFTAQGLRNNQSNSTEELATSFRTSYGNTLKPHHGMMVRPIFSAAMSACPTRANFYEKLGGGNEKTMADMKTWLAALEKQVGILKAFLATKEAQWK